MGRSHKLTPHASKLRAGRSSEIGQAYLVTTVTDDRVPLFTDFICARLAIGALRDCDGSGATSTFAFVLMPEHLHWLFALKCGDLSAVVRRFKSASARRINRLRERVGDRVWQSGFHDHALRMEEDLVKVARYVVGNPVRAGMVRSVREYGHWDAVWL